MKIILNLDFCKRIWKSDIKKIKEPYRTKKLKESCTKLVHGNNKTLNKRNKLIVCNGVRDFLKTYEETEIELEDEDGKFF